MPHITIDGPKITVAKKRRLVQELTQAAVNAYGMDKKNIVVLIKENRPENVGVGGELVIDRRAAGTEKPAK